MEYVNTTPPKNIKNMFSVQKRLIRVVFIVL